MKVTVNGKEEILKENITVLELLKEKNIRPEVVTVELNEKILHRKEYEKTLLKEGDVVELVFFMGGGTSL